MPIDPTTLHGRPWKSLTPEEREACPDGTVLRHPTENFGLFRLVERLWVDARLHAYDTGMMSAADPMGYVVHIPDATPTPDQFREMHQLLGGKTDPTPHIPCPGEKPPVYAIGRFVVVRGDHIYDATRLDPHHIAKIVQSGVDLDTLLHAIAKAEGR